VRADISRETGKPSNFHKHDKHVHINLYDENDANVSYVLRRTKDEMNEPSLLLVGSNGLTLHDQEGTKGKN